MSTELNIENRVSSVYANFVSKFNQLFEALKVALSAKSSKKQEENEETPHRIYPDHENRVISVAGEISSSKESLKATQRQRIGPEFNPLGVRDKDRRRNMTDKIAETNKFKTAVRSPEKTELNQNQNDEQAENISSTPGLRGSSKRT